MSYIIHLLTYTFLSFFVTYGIIALCKDIRGAYYDVGQIIKFPRKIGEE